MRTIHQIILAIAITFVVLAPFVAVVSLQTPVPTVEDMLNQSARFRIEHDSGKTFYANMIEPMGSSYLLKTATGEIVLVPMGAVIVFDTGE